MITNEESRYKVPLYWLNIHILPGNPVDVTVDRRSHLSYSYEKKKFSERTQLIAVHMKNILRHRTYCPTLITYLLDILCVISDKLNVVRLHFQLNFLDIISDFLSQNVGHESQNVGRVMFLTSNPSQ